MVEKDKVYEIWEVLEKYGKYQVIQYVLVCLATLFVTMANINYIFVVGDIGYRCRIPECEEVPDSFTVSWWPNRTVDRCWKPVLGNSSVIGECSPELFSEDVERCSQWVYESMDSVVSYVTSTKKTDINIKVLGECGVDNGDDIDNMLAPSEISYACAESTGILDLACKPWKINMVGTIHNLGMLFSMLIAGWVADRFGRKWTAIFCFTTCFVGVFKVFAISYPMFIGLEFLEAFLSGGCYAVGPIMMIEITGRKYRIFSGVSFAYAIYMGETCFATLAMFIPNWKNLVKVMYGPCILFLGYMFLLHESPRWLILNGKTEQAIKNLKVIAKTNNIKINEQDLTNLDDKKLKQKLNIQNYETRDGLKEVFKSKEMMKRLLIGFMTRFTSNFVYYGLMINSVFLPGNKYTNFLLATVMSFPGEMLSLYLMNKVGRKLPLIIGFIISGAVCVLSAFVPNSMSWAKIAFFLVSKVIVAVCFTGGVTYSMELFPTSARGAMIGMCSLAARLGGMLAPLTPILNGVSVILPTVCFGVSAVTTGLLITLTPETKGTPLMDTIEQVKASARKSKNIQTQSNNLGYTEEGVTI